MKSISLNQPLKQGLSFLLLGALSVLFLWLASIATNIVLFWLAYLLFWALTVGSLMSAIAGISTGLERLGIIG